MEYQSLENAITTSFGNNVRIVSRKSVYGGDINQAYRLTLSDGTSVFMKSSTIKNADFFRAEKEGLEALRMSGTIGVPRPLAVGVDDSLKISFLLMDYLHATPKITNYWEVFGRELALLHRADVFHREPAFLSRTEAAGLVADEPIEGKDYGRFGFRSDNYIGASPQMNTPKPDWITFFRDCRLRPQLEMAAGSLDKGLRKKCDSLLDHLDSFLAEPEFPSLIHGDLWSGNASCGPDGKAWIFDPAVYVGHFEAELAMTELFGRYPVTFYASYHEVNRIDSGYEDRKDLYNLYHMLNHFNLFGGSYLGAVRQIVRRYV
ncbi:MAG: fructosamine kinase family protein [Clostridiales bacterium]|nr:fructosamine kinase family protein [Clostridiales bacterium]